MSFITCFISIFCAFLGLIVFKNILNPQTLFCGFMSLITFLASLRLFGLSETSFIVYSCVIIGCISYSFGAYFGKKIVFVSNKSSSHKTTSNHQLINNKAIFFIVSFLLAWSIYRLFNVVIPMLRSGLSLDYVRLVYFGREFKGYSYSKIDSVIEIFVNLPFIYALIPVVSIELTCSQKSRELNKKLIILIILWIVLSCIITGGRVTIYCFIVVFAASFIFNKRELVNGFFKKMKKRNQIITILIVLGMFFALYELSINRTGTGEYEFFYQLYVYFCGCMPHMSLRLTTIDIEYTYGITFLSGLLRPFMLIYKYLIGNGFFPEIYQRSLDIGEILQNPVVISSGHTYNTFVLPFYYFYYDFGLIGVLIESFIYGFFCGKVFKKYEKTKSKRDLAKYLVVLIYISTSMIRFSPSVVYFMFAFYYIDFCFYKNNKTPRGYINE